MLTVIVGPMFSGKTTEMLRRLERYSLAGKRVMLLRPQTDTRQFLVHSKRQFEGKSIWVKDLKDLMGLAADYEVVGIDEGQMLPELVPYVTELSLRGKDLIIAALNMTSEGKPFTQVSLAMNYADELVKLTAVCMVCGSEHAIMSYYKGVQAKTGEILVGGAELYEARCLRCWQRGVNSTQGIEDIARA